MSEKIHEPYGKLSYGSYLKVPELLNLQQLQSESQAHDEMLFIVIHQAYELWFQADPIRDGLGGRRDQGGRYLRGNARLAASRTQASRSLLVHQIHVLETMTPRDFLSFRSALNPASGFQSVQFRELEFVTGMKVPADHELDRCEPRRARTCDPRRLEEPSLRDLFYQLMQRKGFDVVVPPMDGPARGRRAGAH